MNSHNVHDKNIPVERSGRAEHTISGLGMLTADRPILLERGLTSYIQNAATHLRHVEYVVFDDSKDAANRRASLEAVRALARKFKVEIRFSGFEERAAFVRHLGQFHGVSKNVLANALLRDRGYTVGQNRNAMLLDSVGTLFLCVDDDTVCKLVAPPVPSEGMKFCAGTDPAEFWFFKDFAEACAATRQVDKDFLGAHEELLGKTVEELRSSAPIIYSENHRRGLSGIRSVDSVVRITLNGLLGDCAWGSPFGFWHVPMGYLAFDGSSLERLIGSEEGYRQTLARGRF